ncbi:MAG: UDP-N-acetylmuramoyl-L-alanine--D-glutamate ligase [Treponema sp.]|nr:UDP-N-acetylmuramoyl-L-alanine--D-glutamate ligase [Treponema sp.]
MENSTLNQHIFPEGCIFSDLESIKGKHVTVMGLGLNGGGEASVRFFLKHGANVLATDMKTAEQLKPTIERLEQDKSLDLSHLSYRLGEHRLEDFSTADCVIKNPGVKIAGNKFLAAAKAIETDISIFLHFSKAPLIAVTGSKGKSTTVSAIHYGLCKAGFKAFLGGNITVSPLTFLEETNEKTPVILELSSWQLADLRGRKALKPKISIITKIVPDHQNWYGNMESYVADKRLIYADQTEQDYSIFDADGDEPGTGPECGGTWGDLFARETKAKVLRYSKTQLPEKTFGCFQENTESGFAGKIKLPADFAAIFQDSATTQKSQQTTVQTVLQKLSIPGEHIQTNVLNAALVMTLMGVSIEKTKAALESWTGIAHRLQFFHQWQNKSSCGIFKFYNDSCATVPEAAAAASQAFGKPVIFITGGTDKGLEFNILADTLACVNKNTVPVKKLYMLAGTGTDKLLQLLAEKEQDASQKFGQAEPYNSLEALLSALKADLEKIQLADGEEQPVVFSPGATSFGMFANEFDRGCKFMDGVKKLF